MSRAKFVPAVRESFDVDLDVLKSLGFRLDGRKLVAMPWAGKAGLDVVPPYGNTGGTDSDYSPISLSAVPPIDESFATGPYKISIDALTLSGVLDLDFETDEYDLLLGCVLEPFFNILGFTVSGLLSSADNHLVLEESSRDNRYYRRNYDLALYINTPLGRLRVVCGYFLHRPRDPSQNHFTLRFMGQHCRALGIASGGEDLRPLYDFLRTANPALRRDKPFFRIKRVDIAVDFFEPETGALSTELQQYTSGGYTVRSVTPHVSTIGPAFYQFKDGLDCTVRDTGSTLGIGKRDGSKYLRVYEKLKQMNKLDGDNPYNHLIYPELRYEVELKDTGDYVIPYEVLLCPLAYWAGAYPRLAELAKQVDLSASPEYLSRLPSKNVLDFLNRAIIRASRHAAKLVYAFRAANVRDTTICQVLVSGMLLSDDDLPDPSLHEHIRKVAHDWAYAVPFAGPEPDVPF